MVCRTCTNSEEGHGDTRPSEVRYEIFELEVPWLSSVKLRCYSQYTPPAPKERRDEP